jgi:cytoskeletal protein CcmA (bactofilin family)
MKISWKTVALASLILLFLPTRAVSASSGVFDGNIIFGQPFTLKSGETLTGDLAVIGGPVTIEAGARVQGNVAVIGGTLQVEGEINGDVAVVGGMVHLSETASVSGNLAIIGGSLQRAQGARVTGNILGTTLSGLDWNGEVTIPPATPGTPSSPVSPSWPTAPLLFYRLLRLASTFWRGIPEAFIQSVGLALLAMLLMLFLVQPAERVSQTLVSQPVAAGGIGLLTILVTPLLMVIMVMTILLIPAVPLVVLMLAAALLFGWIVLGYEIGQRIIRAWKWDWHPAFAAGLGTFLLTISTFALMGVPVLRCVGWVFPALLACAALGSVVITAFGTRSPANTAPLPTDGAPLTA